MSTVIFGSYLFRYPLGGMMSWVLQFLLGLRKNGCEVYFVEKAGYEKACFDVEKGIMSNDCSYGLREASSLLKRFGLDNKWCFVDYEVNYHGLSKTRINELFKVADVFIDSGTHGAWSEESMLSNMTAMIDGEPGFTQMKWKNRMDAGKAMPRYDMYFTNGKNIGMPGNTVPTLGLDWKPIYSPVDTTVFMPSRSEMHAAFSTIMNWQSHTPIVFQNRQYGQKDIEFEKFMALPTMVQQTIEVAVAGKGIPEERIRQNKWRLRDAQKVTVSFDSFQNYIRMCRGEFSVCKNVFVATNTGWFSDKSAAYLASGRPVILQDTGFSSHLPVGEGLFAVNNVEEAKEAIERIEADYDHHSKKAREIALEHLDAKTTMHQFLHELGL